MTSCDVNEILKNNSFIPDWRKLLYDFFYRAFFIFYMACMDNDFFRMKLICKMNRPFCCSLISLSFLRICVINPKPIMFMMNYYSFFPAFKKRIFCAFHCHDLYKINMLFHLFIKCFSIGEYFYSFFSHKLFFLSLLYILYVFFFFSTPCNNTFSENKNIFIDVFAKKTL